MVTMLLGGLWHGASWTFVLWGGAHGLALWIHKFYQKLTHGWKGNSATHAVSVLGTFLFHVVTMTWFRAENMTQANQIFAGLFSFRPGVHQPYAWMFVTLILFALALLCAVVRSRKLGLKSVEGFYYCADLSKFWPLVLFFTVIGLTIGLAYTGSNPFIYFQF